MTAHTSHPVAAPRGGRGVGRIPARRRIARWLAGPLCAAVAGCTATTPAAPAVPPIPPIPVSSPSPPADPTAPYVVDGLAEATLSTAPGQPMVVGVPVGVRTGSVVLESATLLPLAGYPVPELAGIGVVTGHGYVIAGWDWPPRTTPTPAPTGHPSTLTVAPLPGYKLTAGRPAAIYYAIRGSRDGGTFYAAGIRLTYRIADRDRAVDLYQVGVDCVVAGYPKIDRQCAADPAAADQIAALGG